MNKLIDKIESEIRYKTDLLDSKKEVMQAIKKYAKCFPSFFIEKDKYTYILDRKGSLVQIDTEAKKALPIDNLKIDKRIEAIEHLESGIKKILGVK